MRLKEVTGVVIAYTSGNSFRAKPHENQRVIEAEGGTAFARVIAAP